MSCGHLRRHLVVTCIRACRKTKPVVGRAEAAEKCAPSHHSRAAAQPEKSCRPGSGRGLAWAPITVSPRTRFGLAILASLALLPVGMCVGGLIATRSNTGGIDVGGEFDANRAFADLKYLVSFGPRPPGSQALKEPTVHRWRTPRSRRRRGLGHLHGLDAPWASPNDQPRREDSRRQPFDRDHRRPLRHQANDHSLRRRQRRRVQRRLLARNGQGAGPEG